MEIADLIDDYTLDEMMQPAEEVEVMRGLRQLEIADGAMDLARDALEAISLEQLTDGVDFTADAVPGLLKVIPWQNLVKRYGKPRYRNEKGEWVDDDMAILRWANLGLGAKFV